MRGKEVEGGRITACLLCFFCFLFLFICLSFLVVVVCFDRWYTLLKRGLVLLRGEWL